MVDLVDSRTESKEESYNMLRQTDFGWKHLPTKVRPLTYHRIKPMHSWRLNLTISDRLPIHMYMCWWDHLSN